MIKYKGINHIALATGDMDSTLRFYRDLLQLPVVLSSGRIGYRQFFLSLTETDMIAFFEWPHVKPIEEKEHGAPVKGPFAFDHIALAVATKDDLWALKDRLEAADQWVSEVVDHGFIHSIYFFDPNGIALEASVQIEGIDLINSPVLADQGATPVALEGSAPNPTAWPPVTTPTAKDKRKVYPGDGAKLFPKDQTYC